MEELKDYQILAQKIIKLFDGKITREDVDIEGYDQDTPRIRRGPGIRRSAGTINPDYSLLKKDTQIFFNEKNENGVITKEVLEEIFNYNNRKNRKIRLYSSEIKQNIKKIIDNNKIESFDDLRKTIRDLGKIPVYFFLQSIYNEKKDGNGVIHLDAGTHTSYDGNSHDDEGGTHASNDDKGGSDGDGSSHDDEGGTHGDKNVETTKDCDAPPYVKTYMEENQDETVYYRIVDKDGITEYERCDRFYIKKDEKYYKIIDQNSTADNHSPGDDNSFVELNKSRSGGGRIKSRKNLKRNFKKTNKKKQNKQRRKRNYSRKKRGRRSKKK